jgi:hypothetical protein
MVEKLVENVEFLRSPHFYLKALPQGQARRPLELVNMVDGNEVGLKKDQVEGQRQENESERTQYLMNWLRGRSIKL